MQKEAALVGILSVLLAANALGVTRLSVPLADVDHVKSSTLNFLSVEGEEAAVTLEEDDATGGLWIVVDADPDAIAGGWLVVTPLRGLSDVPAYRLPIQSATDFELSFQVHSAPVTADSLIANLKIYATDMFIFAPEALRYPEILTAAEKLDFIYSVILGTLGGPLNTALTTDSGSFIVPSAFNPDRWYPVFIAPQDVTPLVTGALREYFDVLPIVDIDRWIDRFVASEPVADNCRVVTSNTLRVQTVTQLDDVKMLLAEYPDPFVGGEAKWDVQDSADPNLVNGKAGEFTWQANSSIVHREVHAASGCDRSAVLTVNDPK